MKKLKPCPFCGGKVIINEFTDYNKIYFSPDCNGEDAGCPLDDYCMTELYRADEGKSKEAVINILIDKWNTRPESAWEMYRRLDDKYGYLFYSTIIYKTKEKSKRKKCNYCLDDIRKLPEKIAIEIMKEVEKELFGKRNK